ncbi:MAG: hypothetical protein KJP21_05725 [Bacteroidia bacterium]|nr:hypothetical protein [Bacteroidia bacterium]
MSKDKHNRPLSNEVKKHFLEIVSTYNKYQEMMDRKSDISEVCEKLGGIVEAARELALRESDDWFDKHTIKRNMSELDKLGKQFDKLALEAKGVDQRLIGLYEDMGHILSRYYKFGELTEDEMKQRLAIRESINEASVKQEFGNGLDILQKVGSTLWNGNHTDSKNFQKAYEVLEKIYRSNIRTFDKLQIQESINEESPTLNKKTKKFLDAYLKDEKKNSPQHQFALMHILKGALTDANFHSEAKQLDKFFPKAKQVDSKWDKMIDVIQDKGVQISNWAKWDGHDIIDALAYYTNMTIGGGFGNKLKSLKESINESKGSCSCGCGGCDEAIKEGISVFDERHFGKNGIIIMIDNNGKKTSAIFKNKNNADKYNRNKPSDVKKLLDLAKKTPYPKAIDESINEETPREKAERNYKPKFKKDDVVYNTKTKTIGIVRIPDDTYGEVKTDADGNVDVDVLQLYNPLKDKKHGNAKIAPSTKKEIEKRSLWKPFQMREAAHGFKDSTAGYINKHNDEYKTAEKINKGNEMKFYDTLEQMEDKIGHPKFMIWLSNALRGYKVDMYKDPKIKNKAEASEALYLLSK